MAEEEQTRVLPERVTMGLLPYINAHAIDEDYALAAERRGTDPATRPRKVGRSAGVVLAVFAILAVTAAVQTSQDSVSEEKERRALIEQVKDRRALLDSQRTSIAALTKQTQQLESALLRGNQDAGGLLADVTRLSLRSGIGPATGPGVQVIADDAPDAESDRNRVLDSDLQKLVNGLWHAGAEAISINGERLTTLSAIRHAGSAITVNYTSLSRPYKILAIGDPKTLPTRFGNTTTGQAWLDLVSEVGLDYSMTTKKSLRLPGAEVPDLRYVDEDEPDRVGSGGKGTS
ncbi:DUF881 domain-containing protein [Nocardioides marmorisolisilvae]|uniref:DUF881 domain-containing protein n=1 Tax=Nocardioides marmorisolisilvae TaxID=1542737 RepID=A0A3N0DUM7_9ACTN|nr:DUF881 domain-containing protein [Nocardioides marmorisolisilvae]RNL79298.1 DUF881 domain-containing protein [Nocardioides marmorisolisilvae]